MAINFSMMSFAERLAKRPDYIPMDEKQSANPQTSPISNVQLDPNMIRTDLTMKSNQGYLGQIKDNKGYTMTEQSIDVDIDGKKVLMPLLVPGLSNEEIASIKENKPLDSAYEKAVAHGRQRIKEGQSPFFEDKPQSIVLESDDVPIGNVGKEVEINNNDFQSKLLPSVFKAEGGYSDDPTDTGNFIGGDTSSALVGTNHGISADVLSEYLKRPATAEDMKSLTKDKAKEIYEKVFYTDMGIDKLPKDVQEIVFHGVVNSKGHAIKVVQKLLGLKEDGVVGPKTIEAMKNADFTKEEFKDALLNKYKTFKTWDKHGEGWTNRFEELAK